MGQLFRAGKSAGWAACLAAIVTAALAAAPHNAQADTAPAPLIIVVMENHGYTSVVGNTAMPYFNTLWSEGENRTGPVTDYTQMYAVSHPSLPNYLAISSGSTWGTSGSDNVSAGEFQGPSLWDQLTAAGISWGIDEEAMPSACFAASTYNDTSAGGTDGQYVLRHNPGTPYAPVYTSSERQNVQPLSALNTSSLPAVSFVTPNLCDDEHGIPSGSYDPFSNCVKGTTALVQRGDFWLQSHVTAWAAAGADVLITWDEGGTNAGANGTTNGGGQIASLLTGPAITAGTDSAQYSHYSVLAGIERRYGLPFLQNAGTANPLPLPGTASTAPTTTISQPASGSVVSGMMTVSGTAQAQGGATISAVQVSVDGGTPQAATGTSSWSATIDTTKLANGTHTITAQATDSNGVTGSAIVTVSVENKGTTACPAAPASATELSGNVSVESGQTGWTGKYNSNSAVTRVEPPAGSYDGLWALQVAPTSGSGTAGASNASPIWVTNTTAGRVYQGSVFVNPSVAGEKISVLVKETTPAGTSVGSHVTTVTAAAGWQQLTSTYTAKHSGDYLRYSVYASNLASPSQNFLADCLSLWGE